MDSFQVCNLNVGDHLTRDRLKRRRSERSQWEDISKKKLPRGCQFSIIFLSCKNSWARYSHIPCQQPCTCPLVARAVRCRDYTPPTVPSICWGGSAWESSSACMRAEGGFPMGGPPGGGPDMAAFPLNSVKALVRHMGTLHVLGVSTPSRAVGYLGPPLCGFMPAWSWGPEQCFLWSLLAALWVRLHEDLSDCRASRGRCIKFVDH